MSILRRYLKEATKKEFTSYFDIGDEVLFGKYKNKKGKIIKFGTDEKDNPFVEIEPIPKGRKKNVIMGLFKIWKKKKEE